MQAWSNSGTVTAKAVRICALVAGKRGVAPETLLGPLGIDLASLEDVEAHVPIAWMNHVWSAAPELSGDPDFGLHAAEVAVGTPSHVVDYIGAHASTPREFFEQLVRFQRILSSVNDIRLEADGATATLSRHGDHATHFVVFVLAQMILFVRRRKTGLALRRATFRHGRPEGTSEYERIFQCPLAFGAARDALEFDARLLDLELDGADPRLMQFIRRHSEALLEQLPRSAPRADTDVRRHLLGLGPGANPTMDEVAHALGRSGRSLQRQLQVEGATFKAVVEAVRRDLALAYLREPRHSVSDVAFMAGFAEVSAFSRAFKRWTGASPVIWRKQHAAPGA